MLQLQSVLAFAGYNGTKLQQLIDPLTNGGGANAVLVAVIIALIRGDMILRKSHEAIVAQYKEALALERENSRKWESQFISAGEKLKQASQVASASLELAEKSQRT